jgi:hypothetical protein
MHEMFGISCHAAGAKDDRYFRLESEGEKIAHCKVNEDSIVNFKINNIKCANVMCQLCDEVNQTSSICSKVNIFDFKNKLLLDPEGKAIGCKYIASLILEWLIESLNNRDFGKLHKRTSPWMISILSETAIGKKYLLTIKKRGRLSQHSTIWTIDHVDEAFELAIRGNKMSFKILIVINAFFSGKLDATDPFLGSDMRNISNNSNVDLDYDYLYVDMTDDGPVNLQEESEPVRSQRPEAACSSIIISSKRNHFDLTDDGPVNLPKESELVRCEKAEAKKLKKSSCGIHGNGHIEDLGKNKNLYSGMTEFLEVGLNIKDDVIGCLHEILNDTVIKFVANISNMEENDIKEKAIRYRVLGEYPRNTDVFVAKSVHYASKRGRKGVYSVRRDIGLGLFANKPFTRKNKIVQFIGEIITFEERNKRVNAGLGFFIIQCSVNKYLDCRIPYELGICFGSFANCFKGLRHKSSNAKGKENSRLSVHNQTETFAVVTLEATCNIDLAEELLYNYLDDYNLTTNSPETVLFSARLQLKLPLNDTTDLWPNRTQGTGFCGMLSIIQAIFCKELWEKEGVGQPIIRHNDRYGKKLLLEKANDRLFFMEKMTLLLSSIKDEELANTIQGQINFLSKLSTNDVVNFKDIILPKELWLSTQFVCLDPGIFLPRYRIFLWRELDDDLHQLLGKFQAISGNFTDAQNYTYQYVKEVIFNPSVVHLYHSGSHFYTGIEYDNTFLKDQLELAIEDAITKLITFLSLGNVKCTCN